MLLTLYKISKTNAMEKCVDMKIFILE